MDYSSSMLTERMLRVISIAEKEMIMTNCMILNPIHLLIACLLERTGVLGEISLKTDFDLVTLKKAATQRNQNINHTIMNAFFNVPISDEVDLVIKEAIVYMKRYNQLRLNEGHLLKAIIQSKVIDDLITEHNRNLILSLGTTARDLITLLQDYSFPTNCSNSVRKVTKSDYEILLRFIENNFSKEWAQTIKDGLLVEDPTIYIAIGHAGEIIGFAAFDVFQKKKCYFGPMGVAKSNRINGIGYSLLHHCLREMKEIGYEYAVIGGAGPIEFYEKACKAVVIPYP